MTSNKLAGGVCRILSNRVAIAMAMSLLSLNGGMHSAHAGSDTVNIATQGLSLLPASFNGQKAQNAAAAQYSNVLTSCSMQQGTINQQGMLDLSKQVASYSSGTGLPIPGPSGTASCGLPSKMYATFQCKDSPVPAAGSTCESFEVGGVFNATLLTSKMQQAQAATCSIECKRSKLNAIQQELQCLSSQSDQMIQQINSQLQQAFTENITRYQTDVATLKGVIKDREIQSTFVKEKLGGSGERGEDGWVKIQGDLTNSYAGMVNEVAEVTELQKAASMQKASLLEQSEMRRASVTAECFRTQVQSSYQCVPNGPPVSAYDYVLCRYEQNQYLSSNGQQVEYDASTKAQATAKTAGLKNILDTIFTNAPAAYKVPTNPDQVAAMASQPIGNLVPANVEATYGGQLTGYDGKGLGIHQFVMDALAACDARSVKQVEKEKTMVNNALGLAIQGAQRSDRQLCAKVDSLFDKYSQQYSAAMTSLTGMNLPLDVSGCRSSSNCAVLAACNEDIICRQRTFNLQTSCLADLKQNMEGLLRGTTQNSNVQILVTANNTKQNISFDCAGVNGCVRKMQNLSTELGKEQEKIKKFKDDYVLKANQNIETFSRQTASRLSPASQQINSRLKDLNSALSQYGDGTAIKIKAYEPEDMSQNVDDDKLYKLPHNIMKVVGGKATPPLMDISGDSFGESLSGMGKATQKLGEDQNKVTEAMNNIMNLSSTCPRRGLKDRLTKLDTLWSSIDGQCPPAVDMYCSKSGTQSSLEGISAAVLSLNTSDAGIDTSIVANINSGIAGICASKAKYTLNAAGERELDNTNLQRCNTVINNIRRETKGLYTNLQNLGIKESGDGNSAIDATNK